MFPFLLLTAPWKVRRAGRLWLLRGLITAIALTAVVGPRALRNERVMHAPPPVRDGFWLEFWAGNSGDTFTSNPAWAHPASNPVEMQNFKVEGETVYLAHKHTMAVSFVRKHLLSRGRLSTPCYSLLDRILGLSDRLSAVSTTGCPKCFLLHLHHPSHDSGNVALV